MIVLEDGSGSNPEANSYNTVANLRTYAGLRGVTLPTEDSDCEALLIKAMDYLEAQRDRYKGNVVSATQPLQWPRDNAYGISFPDALYSKTDIPRNLEYAQLALAIEAINNDLMPTILPSDTGAQSSVKIEGAVEVVYRDPTGGGARVPAFAKAEALLSVLYKNNGLTLIRT